MRIFWSNAVLRKTRIHIRVFFSWIRKSTIKHSNNSLIQEDNNDGKKNCVDAEVKDVPKEVNMCCV